MCFLLIFHITDLCNRLSPQLVLLLFSQSMVDKLLGEVLAATKGMAPRPMGEIVAALPEIPASVVSL